ncbi:uncharacterized protein LOC135559887 [Oncorhynchus nerka]|uniref:uncharacterized protein LOC135559887 n=1 Tax=Oncorhynchus nerka TaxID=8023 RepID=UPI0031B804D2
MTRELEDDPTMSLPDLDDRLPPVPPLRKATQPNPSQVPVVTPPDDTAPAASRDPEDDENIGPDGVSGYQHVVLLATSLPPPPSLSSTSLPITPVSQDLPSTSTPLPPPAGGPKVSRTTEWRRRKKLESGIKVRVHKPYEGYKCSKCGKPKTSEFGHSMYGSVRFCAATSGGQTVEWLALMRTQHGAIAKASKL